MKNFSKKLLALLLVVVSIFALAGCGNGDKLTGEVTIVLVGETEVVYKIDLEEGGFSEGDTGYNALVYLNEKEGVEFSATTSFVSNGFDAFVNSIGDLNPVYGSTQYVALFHNVEAKKDVSQWALEDRVFDGTTLYYSGVGVGGLKLKDGLVICFVIESY